MAAEGNEFLDPPLAQMFEEQGIHDGKDISAHTQEFHREGTLARIGAYFQLKDCVELLADPNNKIPESEIKEVVEALIGACAQVNGDDIAATVVQNLNLLALKQHFLEIE